MTIYVSFHKSIYLVITFRAEYMNDIIPNFKHCKCIIHRLFLLQGDLNKSVSLQEGKCFYIREGLY